MSWQQQQPYNPSYGGQNQQSSQQPPQGSYQPPYNPAVRPPPPNAPPLSVGGGYSQPPGGPPTSHQPPNYGAPPPANYGASGGAPSYGSPQSSYGAPQPSYRTPPQSTGGPGSSYGGSGGYGASPPSGGGASHSQQQDELLSWFQAVDKDHSGKITALELREALVNSNWSHFNAETCRLLIGIFDKNNDGTIDFHEFADLWKYVRDWKTCFNKFDTDGSGNIDARELQQALLSFSYRVSIDFCNLCTRVFDRSDQRTMKFDDFIQCCVMLRSLTESFKTLDTNRSGVINVNYEQFLEMAIDNSMR